MGIFRSVVSSVSVFLFLASIINIILSVLVYYTLPDARAAFLEFRWYASFCILFILLLKGNVVINNIKL